MQRIITGVIIVLGLSVLVFLVNLPIEAYVLETVLDVTPRLPIRQPVWIDTFLFVGQLCLLGAVICSLLWIVGGYFVFSIVDWRGTGHRRYWILTALILVVTNLLSGYFLNFPAQDSGVFVAIFFYLLNSTIIFWVSTLLVSPAGLKYAPPGSVVVRRPAGIRKILR